MRSRFAGVVLALSLSGCATVTLEDLAMRCDAYGFKRNSEAHANCLQKEVRAYEAQQAQTAARWQAASRAMQQLDTPAPALSDNYSPPSASGPLVRSYISGPNQICVYNVMGNATARTIPMGKLCPQWGN